MTAEQITELDPQTVERIAAGEVIERPASAVKELVENSIDADANRLTVAVDDGGKERISVTDDGIGMSRAAVQRAVEKHTTSKITNIEDLERGVGTLGFRGEALHAIGAVSRLTITTRPRGGEQGTELTVEGGEITEVSPAGCPEGTTVAVRDLFYNVPARRKYLKQDATEFAHVNSVVTNYALANPGVAVTLEHNDRETFATTGSDDLTETIMAVYGREVAESMIELDGADLPDGPLDDIRGLVSHPETNRSSREYLSTFVNGRYVKATSVRESIDEAYGGQLAADRYPFAVVFLDVDPATVDVNVHPRKREVRFADETGLRSQVETVVEEALLREGLLRSSAPRGRSAVEQTKIRPDNVKDGQTGGETPPATDDPPGGTADSVNSGGSDSTPSHPTDESTAEAGDRTARNECDRAAEDEASGDSIERDPLDGDGVRASETSESPPRSGRTTRPDAHEERRSELPTDRERSKADRSERVREKPETVEDTRDRPTPNPPDRKFRTGGEQERLDAAEGGIVEFEFLPPMRILGQLQDTYIVAETDAGLVLVDQHAADERINYERLRNSFSEETTTQALATPVELELTAREAELFRAHRKALATLGFHASLTGDRTVEVTTVPSLIADAAEPSLLRAVLDDLVTSDSGDSSTVEAAADELLADLACYPSITGNTSLTEGSVVDLLTTLDDCENPYACPHGRPVIVEFDTDELEARFERDYPGHGG